MLTRQQEQILSQIFSTTAYFEGKIEITRSVLADQQEFHPVAAFNRIDRKRRNLLYAEDILLFLQQNDFENEFKNVQDVTLDECNLLIRCFDMDGDNCLNQHEFNQLVLPGSRDVRKILNQREEYVVDDMSLKLPFDVEYALLRIFLQEIQMQNNLENLRLDLSQVDPAEAFKVVKCHDPNYIAIERDQMKIFLERNGEQFPIPEKDIDNIFRRYDRDYDQRINFSEFQNAIIPFVLTNNQIQTMQTDQSFGMLNQSSFHQMYQTPNPNRNQSLKKLKSRQPASCYSSAKKASRIIDVTSMFQDSTKPSEAALSRSFSRKMSYQKGVPSVQSGILFNEQSTRASRVGTSPLRTTNTSKVSRKTPNRNFYSPIGTVNDYGTPDLTTLSFIENNQIGHEKLQVVRPSAIRSIIDRLEADRSEYGRRESQIHGAATGSLAEEYAAKYIPKSKIGGPGAFKMPIRPPKHMEYYEEDVLAETIKEIIEIDKDVELRKNSLALTSDFNVHDFYAIFDQNNKGHINFREFREIYDMFRIYPQEEYLRLTFRQLDKDLDQKISLKEFMKGFLPKDKNYRDVIMRRDSYNDGTNFSRLQSFTPNTQQQFINFLKACVDCEANHEKVRKNLMHRRNFNYQDAFKALDTKDKNYIVLNDIRDFMTERYYHVSDMEIQYFIDRFDKTNCGQIGKNEFIKELRPKCL